MRSIPRNTIERSLASKGFEQDARDHRFYYFIYQGRRTRVRTKISTGTGYRDYGADLIRKMTRQLGNLTFREACDLLACPMDQAEYERVLLSRNVLP